MKKGVLKNSQNSQKNTFLIKLQTLVQMVACEF